MTEMRHRTYQLGTLVLDVVDPKTHAVVWRGAVTGAFNNRDSAYASIPEIVERILSAFPPKL